MKKNRKGEAGIGTMIILIGFILVAVLTAGIIISNANLLQSQVASSGREAKTEVAGQFEILTAYGIADITTDNSIDDVYLKVTIAPGSPELRINDTIIEVSNGTDRETLDFAATPDSDSFAATAVRDPAGNYASIGTLARGTVIRIQIDTEQVFGATGLTPQTPLTIKIIPKHGQEVLLSITTPDAYTGEYVDLY
jgi:flagellin FlaB